MKDKLRLFMLGRYGIDAFSKFLMRVALILCILDLFLNNIFISILLFASIVYVYFRTLSKNLSKRAWENMKYIQIKSNIVEKCTSIISTMKQRKTHHIYKCPTCGQKIRIPKGKGRICITCPKCKTKFTKTS